MRILGIDPGSIATGFGVIDQSRGTLTLVHQGCISASRNETLAARVSAIYEGLSALIALTHPEVVAVESAFHGLNVKSLIQLSHARGVILLAATRAGLPVHEYSPRSVKSAVVGYGGAEKPQVAHMVGLLIHGLNGTKIEADAADALAVAICHAHTCRPVASDLRPQA